MNARIECDGECEEHIGQIETVYVFGNGWVKPWKFNYCEEAKRIDTERGFTVQTEDEYDAENSEQ